MLNVLLKLLGVRGEGAARVVDGAVAFHGAVGIGWIFVAMMGLGVLAFWLYHRSDADVSPLRKYLLGVLRTVFLVLVLLLLLRPVLALTIEGSVRRTLVLLMDASRT